MARNIEVGLEIDFDDNGAIRGVRQITDGLHGVEGAGKRASRGAQLFGAALGALSLAAVGRELFRFGTSIIQTGAKFETLAIQLKAVMGSSEGAGRALEWVKEFTLATPYQLEQVTNAFVKLKAMGLNPMSGALQAVADATSYLGGSAETMNSLVLALGKSFTIGKMSMEEMRMMMEKGVPVIDILADKLEVSTGEILKMSSAGKIGRDEIGLLIDAMREMYGGASAELMNTFTGKWSNLRDQIDKTLDSLANTGALEAAKGALDIVITGLEKASEMFEKLAENSDLTDLTASMQELARATDALSSAVTDSNVLPFFFALGQIKLANDIEKVASATRMLAAATGSFMQHGGGSRGIVSAIVGMSSAARENARDVYKMARSHKTAEERAKDLVIQANRNIDAMKLLNKSLTDRRNTLRDLYSQEEDQLEIWKDLEYQAKLNADADEYWLKQTKEGFEEVQAELDEYIRTMQIPIVIPAPPTAPVINAFEEIGQSFSDLLGKGFMGELETFSDLWDAIWQDLAKSMMGILGNAFEDLFKPDGKGIGGMLGSFNESIQENRLGAGIGGAGMMYGGYQQGGAGGFLQGAMGGAMSGGALAGMLFGSAAGPIGMAIGAAVGGIMSLFGGTDKPRSGGYVGMTGGQITSLQGHDNLSGAERALWSQERVEEYRGAVMAMNDVLRLFGEGELFDLIGDAPTWDFAGGSLDRMAQVFREQWLPDAMRGMFQSAIDQGLGSLGVDDATVRQLWSEVDELTGANQIIALQTFIGSLVNLADLYASMDWNTILDETRQDSLTAFLGGMGNALEAAQTQMLGLDSMTLLERADQATTITQLITSARQAEIQMLMQIDALQEGINRSINAQIEGLLTGDMSGAELKAYYGGQITDIMGQLRGGVGSPEQIQQLMADLQRYVGQYQTAMGDQLYAEGIFGGTEAGWLQGILEEARGLSNEAFESMRDQIRESNDALVAELQRLIEALQHFGGAVGAGGATASQLDVNGNIDITIHPSNDFWASVDSRIDYRMAALAPNGPFQ